MEISRFAVVLWHTLCILLSVVLFPSTSSWRTSKSNTVHAVPIIIDFSVCEPVAYPTSLYPNATILFEHCCPVKPTGPIIDGPRPGEWTTKKSSLRVRKAAQCTDAAYAAKLKKGYELMRALPDDDPRSFKQQWKTHCAYCGGSFITTSPNGTSGQIDIHFSWLFYPWHRWFLFFHERILQSLLNDPTFSLNFWNWDSPYTVGPGGSVGPACLSAGADFPAHLYGDVSAATYDGNRSANAKGHGRLHFPDLTFSPLLSAVDQPLYNAPAEEVVASNVNVLFQAMVSGGTTQTTFLGRPYRAGGPRGFPSVIGGAGSLELSAHAGAHFWTGRDPPINTFDMGTITFSSRDPVFYAHHSNIDRLWEVWKSLGPLLGQTREDYSDLDFLNAEFLFYDENKDLRRVKLGDALDTTKLGYVYQETNDAAWIYANQTKCSNLSYTELLNQAAGVPMPKKDSAGFYHLEAGKPFIIEIDRPLNPHGLEEFLVIEGIKVDRINNCGFDVFLNMVYPSNYTSPWKCAEYSGRFVNMAQGYNIDGDKQLTWQESITRTLVDIQAEEAPSKLVVALRPLSRAGHVESIKFTSISITYS